MIIVKQDKKGIVNFNNVTDIYIDKEEEGNRCFVFYIPISNLEGIDILGEYATEERAKEVIGEIQVAYADFKYFEIMKKEETAKRIVERYGTFNIYKMPKE